MFKSFFTVSFFISISRILGFIRDILIARYIGVSVISDAFFAAFRLPNFFRRIFAEGAFNSAFVPIFVNKLSANKNHESSQQLKDSKIFLANIFSFLLYSLLIFVLLVQIFMPFFMKILFPGFFQDKIKADLLISFSRITIFYLIFISLVSLCSGILNSINKFAIPASSPIILNATLIIAVLAFGSYFPNYGYVLSWGVLVGGILQFIVIFIAIIKNGFLVYPKIPSINKDIKIFFRKLIPGIIGANVMQINLLVDSIFASMILGAISYLYYADRINQLPLAMIGIAIGIALLPNLSKKIKNQDYEGAIKTQNLAIEVALILVIPATLALTILSYPIISTLFQGGAFGDNETNFVSKALMYYSFGLPSFVLVKVMEPAFFARQNTKTPMIIAICCLVTNIIFNYVFMLFDYGFVGIILSSIASTYLNLSLLIYNLLRKKYFHFEKFFIKKLIKIVIPSLLMGISLYFLKLYFTNNNDFNKILELIIMISLGIMIYFFTAYLSGSLKIMIDAIKIKRQKNDAINL
jgi:putative peptidoglycan lipid II flippase